MADDLSAPLGRKRRSGSTGRPARATPRLPALGALTALPLARITFGVLVLIGLGVGARVLLVHDPDGGRPTAEIAINRNGNALADSVGVSAPGTGAKATITAGPEMPASGGAITVVGDDVPNGDPDARPPQANADGLYPDLLESSEHGAIPRISASGQTPFEAYAPPSLTLATAGGKPLIAVVVTGLGLNQTGTASAIDTLPGPITLAFAPYGPSLGQQTSMARTAGHEILLEVPLEPFDYPVSDPGPDTLLTGQAPRDNLDKLFTVMGKFGGYVGVINHMGARFTASTADFNPIMEELATRGLGYLDDGSSKRSLSQQLATANAVEYGRADMVLDADPAPGPIADQLAALEAKATADGAAIGVISALPVSMQTLAAWAKTVGDRGFTIVPVSALMQKPT